MEQDLSPVAIPQYQTNANGILQGKKEDNGLNCQYSLQSIDKLFRIWYSSSMKGIWSVKEAANKLGISERRVRKLLAEGRIKGKKLDGTWVVFELSYTKKRG